MFLFYFVIEPDLKLQELHLLSNHFDVLGVEIRRNRQHNGSASCDGKLEALLVPRGRIEGNLWRRRRNRGWQRRAGMTLGRCRDRVQNRRRLLVPLSNRVRHDVIVLVESPSETT